jgi:hypothetical protein
LATAILPFIISLIALPSSPTRLIRLSPVLFVKPADEFENEKPDPVEMLLIAHKPSKLKQLMKDA